VNRGNLSAGRMIPPMTSLVNSSISNASFSLHKSDAEASTAEALAALGSHGTTSVKH
jgi:hypothetical protein